MILVIIAIGLAAGIAGYFMYHESERDSHVETFGIGVQIVGWTLAGLATVMAMILFISSLCSATADKKIAMYEEENAKIEQQVAVAIEQYQQHETDIFTEVAPESSMTLVSMYPELKSDKLVQSQIDLYVSNNKQIKELKEMLIDRSIVNWWLYFGN
jgi:hypothetical protein